MQEVWGLNPHSSTGQEYISNGPNAEYSSKVQQPRSAISCMSVLMRSPRGVWRRPELGRREIADLLTS
jgi:hypothetical protein